MLTGLLIILALVLILPFLIRFIEHNLEMFLFIMGLTATAVSGILTFELLIHILENRFLYLIAAAVLIAGLIFKAYKHNVKIIVNSILRYIPLKVFIFLTVAVLGLFSSVITAIVASLLLVEIVHVLPLDRKNRINLNIIACFSIGLGAVLTPVGEPLSTVVVTKLNSDFWYIFDEIGILVIPGVLAFALLASIFVKHSSACMPSIGSRFHKISFENHTGSDLANALTSDADRNIDDEETYLSVIIRAAKILLFVVALELLGSGFKPLIDIYIIDLECSLLYWLSMSSAVLDNATLAAAEISPRMAAEQIKAILMGLLVSGGMLIPGNIPNIISSSKLKIKSSDWARVGVPLGFVTMSVYFILIFVI